MENNNINIDNDSNKEEKKKNDGELMEWLKSIALAVVLAIIIKTFIFSTTFVMGSSMYPTLLNGDKLFSVRVPLYFREPERGDIVVFKAPDDPEKDYIKRVIGIPGDIIEIFDGKVFLNGSELEEDYIEKGIETYTYEDNFWKVEEGEVFVLGDNRRVAASKDSRYFDVVDQKLIKGIANFRYYPFDNRFGRLK